MDNYCVRFQVRDENESAILLALLEDFPFYSFVEEEEVLEAYVKEADWTADLKEAIRNLDTPFDIQFESEHLPYQNWNAIWEANFQPIEVPGFCGIRAHFHPEFTDVKHEIVIDPEMAFGTGHHATTYMVIQLMEELDFSGSYVLDYGCGTGILAILAAKMEAARLDAVDIEQPAYENTLKNSKINSVNNINAIHGTLQEVDGQGYNYILANINRNVILDSLDALFDKAASGASLILSGILRTDMEEVKQAARNSGFLDEKHLEKSGWIAILLSKV